MKPLSIKIDSSETMFDHEQVASNFQQYCFSKEIGWHDRVNKPLHLEREWFSIIHNNLWDKGINLYGSHGCKTEDREVFTLPTDWKAFTSYLDEYIAYHSKPVPKIGDYWEEGIHGRIVLIDSMCESPANYFHCIGADDFEVLRCSSQLKRPATPEEIESYNKTRKEAELLEEAKRRYPEGIKLKSAYNIAYQGVSSGEVYWDVYKDLVVKLREGFSMIVYHEGKWAEILKEETPQQKELAELKKLKRRLANKSLRVRELEEMVKQLIERIEAIGEAKQDEYYLNDAIIEAAENLLNKKS